MRRTMIDLEKIKARASEIRGNVDKVRKEEKILAYARKNLADFEDFLAAVLKSIEPA
jgi:hypothetical protein